MTPKQFIESQNDGYIAGDYTPTEVYSLMSDYTELLSKNEEVDIHHYQVLMRMLFTYQIINGVEKLTQLYGKLRMFAWVRKNGQI